MKKLIREIRLLLFWLFIGAAVCFLPSDAVNTWKWLKDIPTDDN